jgi:hypothetical protein
LGSLASIYNKGQENCPVSEFEEYLELFSKAKNCEVFSGANLLEVRYEVEGEKKVFLTQEHILLAACHYVMDTFFKNPLENLPDAHNPHKTAC